MADQQMSPQDTMKDPKFLALPPEARQHVLSTIDPEFNKLPPEAQMHVVTSLGGSAQPQQQATADTGLKYRGVTQPLYNIDTKPTDKIADDRQTQALHNAYFNNQKPGLMENMLQFMDNARTPTAHVLSSLTSPLSLGLTALGGGAAGMGAAAEGAGAGSALGTAADLTNVASKTANAGAGAYGVADGGQNLVKAFNDPNTSGLEKVGAMATPAAEMAGGAAGVGDTANFIRNNMGNRIVNQRWEDAGQKKGGFLDQSDAGVQAAQQLADNTRQLRETVRSGLSRQASGALQTIDATNPKGVFTAAEVQKVFKDLPPQELAKVSPAIQKLAGVDPAQQQLAANSGAQQMLGFSTTNTGGGVGRLLQASQDALGKRTGQAPQAFTAQQVHNLMHEVGAVAFDEDMGNTMLKGTYGKLSNMLQQKAADAGVAKPYQAAMDGYSKMYDDWGAGGKLGQLEKGSFTTTGGQMTNADAAKALRAFESYGRDDLASNANAVGDKYIDLQKAKAGRATSRTQAQGGSGAESVITPGLGGQIMHGNFLGALGNILNNSQHMLMPQTATGEPSLIQNNFMPSATSFLPSGLTSPMPGTTTDQPK